MSFKENINRICKQQGTTLTALCKSCGFAGSKASAINRGQLPNEEQLTQFALRLQCSVASFFYDNNEESSATATLTPEEEELLTGFRKMPQSLRYRLLGYYYELKESMGVQ